MRKWKSEEFRWGRCGKIDGWEWEEREIRMVTKLKTNLSRSCWDCWDYDKKIKPRHSKCFQNWYSECTSVLHEIIFSMVLFCCYYISLKILSLKFLHEIGGFFLWSFSFCRFYFLQKSNLKNSFQAAAILVQFPICSSQCNWSTQSNSDSKLRWPLLVEYTQRSEEWRHVSSNGDVFFTI